MERIYMLANWRCRGLCANLPWPRLAVSQSSMAEDEHDTCKRHRGEDLCTQATNP